MSDSIIIPRLRFPGFTGEWEEKKALDVCKTITPPRKLQSSDYLPSGTYPVVDQSHSLICGWTNDIDGLITDTPVIIFGDHTCILKYIDFPFVQGADGVKILAPQKGINPQFIYQSFLANPVKQDGYKRHFSDFKENLYMFPTNLAEQEKIAGCLMALDELIAAQGQKVDALKERKRGLMQQLFPQHGETTPRLRFPGFTGNWQEKKLFEVADVLQGFGFPDKYQGQKDGELPFYKVGDISSAFDKGKTMINEAANYVDYALLPKLHAKPIPEGATIFAKIGEAIRSNKRVMTSAPCLIDNNTAAVKAGENTSDNFLYDIMLQIHLADYSGGVVPSVNKSTIEAIPILLPPTLSEQEKIAGCLMALDELIAAQGQKVEALKERKRGLMQQLFPQSSK